MMVAGAEVAVTHAPPPCVDHGKELMTTNSDMHVRWKPRCQVFLLDSDHDCFSPFLKEALLLSNMFLFVLYSSEESDS